MRINENYTKIIIDENEKNVLYNLVKLLDNICYATLDCAECNFATPNKQCLLKHYEDLLLNDSLVTEDEIK